MKSASNRPPLHISTPPICRVSLFQTTLVRPNGVLAVDPSPELLTEPTAWVDPAKVVEPFPEVIDVLDQLRARGVRLAVVSDAWPTLPIGVQLVAPYGREDVLFRVGAQLEQSMPWHDRRPPVSAVSESGRMGA